MTLWRFRNMIVNYTFRETALIDETKIECQNGDLPFEK